jgi:hypothetical protein
LSFAKYECHPQGRPSRLRSHKQVEISDHDRW